MGGPKKGQWGTILLIKASTAGVCEKHNLLPSKILPRSYLLQTLGNLFLSSSSPGSKEKNTNLLD